MEKHLRRRTDNGEGEEPLVKKRRRSEPLVVPVQERGAGTAGDPRCLPLRDTLNDSGCLHCPTSVCDCVWFTELLEDCYNHLSCKREVMRPRRSELCAKSVLAPFVSRLVRLCALKEGEVFYDFGCGNGSVVFQVAYLTGCKCVGIEINPTNAQVAREAWRRLRPTLEKRCGRKLEVVILCDDFCQLLKNEGFFGASCVVWAANLLLPKPVNHYLAERFRTIPSGSRIFCFEDLYPHSRSVAATRDPDAFSRFEMLDYRWQPQSVEWCDIEGSFFQYTRK